MPFASNMNGPRDLHAKCGLSYRERQILYDISYMWNLKYDTDELIYETETDSWTKRTDCSCRGGKGGGGMDWEFGNSRYKLFYVEWIINKVQNYTAQETVFGIL